MLGAASNPVNDARVTRRRCSTVLLRTGLYPGQFRSPSVNSVVLLFPALSVALLPFHSARVLVEMTLCRRTKATLCPPIKATSCANPSVDDS